MSIIHDKISANTKIWLKDSNNKKIFLKGKDLDEAVYFLNHEGANFLLKIEIEYIKNSLSESRKRKFLYSIVLLGIAGGVYYGVGNNYISIPTLNSLNFKNETNSSQNATKEEKKESIEIKKESDKVKKEFNKVKEELDKVKKESDKVKEEAPEIKSNEILSSNKVDLIQEAMNEKIAIKAKHLLAFIVENNDDKSNEKVAKILFNSLNFMEMKSLFKIDFDIKNFIITKDVKLIVYNENKIAILDVKNLKKISSLKQKDISLLKLTPSQDKLVGISNNKEIKVWDINGKPLYIFNFKKIDDVTFSGDSKQMIVANEDSVSIFDLNKGKKISNFKHKESVQSGLLNNAENRLLTISNERVLFWDFQKAKLLLTIATDEKLDDIKITKDDKRVLSVSKKYAVLWSAANGKKLLTIKSDSDILSASFLNRERNVIITNSNNEIKIYDMRGKDITNFKENAKIENFSFNQDETMLLVNTQTNSNLYNLKTKNKILELKNKAKENNSYFLNSDKQIIACENVDELSVYDIASKEKLYSLYNSNSLQNYFVVNDEVITRDSENIIKLWENPKSMDIEELKVHADDFKLNKEMNQILSLNGNIFKLYDRNAMDKPIIFNHKYVENVKFSQDNSKIVSSSKKEIILWDSNKREKKLIIEARKNENFINASFSNDDTILVVTANNLVSLYDVKEAKEIGSYEYGNINSAKLSTDNKNLLIASKNGLKFLNLDSKKGYILDYKNAKNAFFNKDATKFYTINKDEIKIWDVEKKESIGKIDIEVENMLLDDDEVLLLAFNARNVFLIDIKNARVILKYSHEVDILDANFLDEKIISYDKSGIMKIKTLFDIKLNKKDYIDFAKLKTTTLLEDNQTKAINYEELEKLLKKFKK